MSKKYDIIVIGGGHNGLTTAAILAKNKKKVLLVEKRDVLGGIAAGEEFVAGYCTAGLLNDTSAVRSKVIEELNLEKFGLQSQKQRPSVALLGKNGKCLHLTADVQSAAEEISKFSKKDAEAYKEYHAFIDKIRPFINKLMNETPPDLVNFGRKQIWELAKKGMSLKKLGKKTMMEFLKVAPMSVADFLNEKFETDFIKASLAAPAIYGSYTGPWSSYTTLNLLMWECAANECILGGPQALVKALEKAAENTGVEIRKDCAVEKIMLDESKNVLGVKLTNGEKILSPIVASSCTPRETFYALLMPNQIDYKLEESIRNYRSRGTTAKINFAIDRALHINEMQNVRYARTGNSFDEMERAFDSVKYRKASKEPILDIYIPSVDDNTLAPEDHAVVSVVVHFAPHHFDEGWSDKTKGDLLKNTVETIEQYIPEFSKSIVGTEVLSPVDLEVRYGLTFGHIYHGEHAIDQLITRPIPSCARYATPISGLYLCGSGSHPGGGITCMPGYLGAKAILKKN